jgi:hypothetical protein
LLVSYPVDDECGSGERYAAPALGEDSMILFSFKVHTTPHHKTINQSITRFLPQHLPLATLQNCRPSRHDRPLHLFISSSLLLLISPSIQIHSHCNIDAEPLHKLRPNHPTP